MSDYLTRVEISMAVTDALNEESFDALTGELDKILGDMEDKRKILEGA